MNPTVSVLTAFALILGASVWALSGSSETDPFRDVHTLTIEPEALTGDSVAVKGTVVAGSIDTSSETIRFELSDASGNPEHNGTSIDVVYRGVLPDAFGPKLVVVTGTLVETPDGLVLEAQDIQVGCSSKY